MATTDIWTYREQAWTTSNFVGYGVEALDGGIGKIDEASYDVGAGYIVVDTGPWIFGKKVMLPAGVISRVDHDDEKVYVEPHEGPDQERARVRRGSLPRRRLPRRARLVLRQRRRRLARLRSKTRCGTAVRPAVPPRPQPKSGR